MRFGMRQAAGLLIATIGAAGFISLGTGVASASIMEAQTSYGQQCYPHDNNYGQLSVVSDTGIQGDSQWSSYCHDQYPPTENGCHTQQQEHDGCQPGCNTYSGQGDHYGECGYQCYGQYGYQEDYRYGSGDNRYGDGCNPCESGYLHPSSAYPWCVTVYKMVLPVSPHYACAYPPKGASDYVYLDGNCYLVDFVFTSGDTQYGQIVDKHHKAHQCWRVWSTARHCWSVWNAIV